MAAASLLAALLMCATAFPQTAASFSRLSPPPVFPHCDTTSERECVEVSTAEELREALADNGVREVVIMAPEIVLDEPTFSPINPVNLTRDVLVRGSEPGKWPKLVNRMGDLPSDTVINLYACLMFLRVRIEGWMLLSESSVLKKTFADNAILSSPGVYIRQRDSDAGPVGDDFLGKWMTQLDNRLYTPDGQIAQMGFYSGVLVHESEADIQASLLISRSAELASSPWLGLFDLIEGFGFEFNNFSVEDVRVLEWPLRSIFFQELVVVPFWSWGDLIMYNSTLLWKGEAADSPQLPVQVPELPPRTDCQSSGLLTRGLDYRGNVSIAGTLPDSASECMFWKDVNFLGANFSGLEGNSCRNPGTIHSGAFCFKQVELSQLDLSFPYLEPCNIPACLPEGSPLASEDCQRKEDMGQSYNGTQAFSESGKPCKKWTDVMYAIYQSRDRNYCRNPNGQRDRLWCYTGQGYDWEYCNVEICQNSPQSMFPGLDGMDELLDSMQPPVPSQFPGPQEAHSDGGDSTSSSSNGPLIIGLTSAAGAFVLLGAAVALLLLRRWRHKSITTASELLLMSRDMETAALQRRNSEPSTIGSTRTSSLRSMPATNLVKILTLDKDPVILGLIELEEAIGTGYTAQVWRSRWKGVEVASKVLMLDLLQSSVRDAVLTGMEASLVSELSHPNIIRTFQIYHISPTRERFEKDDLEALDHPTGGYNRMDSTPQEANLLVGDKRAEQLWIVQEYCRGGDLGQAIREQRFHSDRELDVAAVLRIVRQIALALKYLHSAGIVHGDLKCDNVLLDNAGGPTNAINVKVTDFGLAHALPAGVESYTSNNVIGDYKYMAPEAILDHEVSAKMDTYSLGLVMYELVTGKKVPADTTPVRHATRLACGERPEFPSTANLQLQELAQSCWAQQPENRPSDDEVIRRLEQMENGVQSSNIQPVVPGSVNSEHGYICPQSTASEVIYEDDNARAPGSPHEIEYVRNGDPDSQAAGNMAWLSRNMGGRPDANIQISDALGEQEKGMLNYNMMPMPDLRISEPEESEFGYVCPPSNVD